MHNFIKKASVDIFFLKEATNLLIKVYVAFPIKKKKNKNIGNRYLCFFF